MKTKYFNLVLIVLLTISFTGCINVNREFKEIRNNFLEFSGQKVKQKFEFGIGAAGLSLVGGIVRFAEQDDLPADIISYLSSIQVGVYERSRQTPSFKTSDFHEFNNDMRTLGWQYIVRSVDDGAVNMVFVRNEIEDEINEMLVLSCQEDELAIVTLEGNLDDIVAVVIKNKSFGISLAEN